MAIQASGVSQPIRAGFAVHAPQVADDAAEALKCFRAIFRSVRNQMHEIEQRCGISGSQLWALAIVVDAPGLRVKDLSKAMAVQQSTASNLVEQLARAGLLERQRDPVDHRIVLLFPTEAGAALIASEPGPLAGILPDALSRLDPSRLKALNRLLGQLVAELRRRDSGGLGARSLDN